MTITSIGIDPIVIKPKNDTLVRQYMFAIKAIAEGGAFKITQTMTLNVGCGFWNEIT
jgi:hypothetical protein